MQGWFLVPLFPACCHSLCLYLCFGSCGILISALHLSLFWKQNVGVCFWGCRMWLSDAKFDTMGSSHGCISSWIYSHLLSGGGDPNSCDTRNRACFAFKVSTNLSVQPTCHTSEHVWRLRLHWGLCRYLGGSQSTSHFLFGLRSRYHCLHQMDPLYDFKVIN